MHEALTEHVPHVKFVSTCLSNMCYVIAAHLQEAHSHTNIHPALLVVL